MIKAIFYSKFDTQEGPKVVHQVPDGAIVPSPTAPASQPLLVTFPVISFFVIPRQELCGNFIHVCSNGYRILGTPICMKSPRYDRNEFIFNFCIVLAEDEEFASFKSVVRKLADLMCGLEEQSGFLSRDFSRGGEGKVYSLCETLMEDLNNYAECMIPIDELNTLNIKLFPTYSAPPMVKAWYVPLFTVRYEAFMDENWDLTMQRIVPYINGVNSIRKISVLADADFLLTCRAIRHLMYYGCVFLLDIFSFSAIYAPTAQFASTIPSNEEMQRECARYVNTRFAPAPTLSSSSASSSMPPFGSTPRAYSSSTVNGDWLEYDDIWPLVGPPAGTTTNDIDQRKTIVDGVGIVELYSSLRQGLTVKQWYISHACELANIDIRRFITFGVIKGFLYRVHKYPYATGNPAQSSTIPTIPTTPRFFQTSSSSAIASPAFSRGRGGSMVSGAGFESSSQEGPSDGLAVVPSVSVYPEDEEESDYERDEDFEDVDDDDYDSIDDKTLAKYLDGMHCFDQICTELEISEKELTSRLKRYPGEVEIIHR
ncbi:hypothetical protein AJ80_09130 [Polytolypa hystricis UAMH7299]|uniref:Nitrogen permease regulator 2 n=1 Tax=Polytolypa hystricis (strain UAMH7299) TaxID=1447883 RepID=A0A2B7WWC5_POLH7|nr:hypothetical protein AJ80_09130 [Polytolypa hystricis UAMH7299]